MDGIEATRKGLKLCPGISIIALSMYGEEEYYYKMVDAGAKGFLLKDSDISEVKEAILTVLKGRELFFPSTLIMLSKNSNIGKMKVKLQTCQKGKGNII